MATERPASSPTVAIARVLRRLGLAQGRGGDFRVTGEYRNGERICTYVVTLTRHADETIATHADDIERWVSEDGGWAFHVSVRYADGKPRPFTHVSNGPGERVREQPPAAAAALEEAAQPVPADEPEPVEDSEPVPEPAPPADDPQDLHLQRAQAAALGWSAGQADLVIAAAAGFLYRHPFDGTLRRQDLPGATSRIVADHRLAPLVKAGFLTIGEADQFNRRPIRVTADGRRAVMVWKRWRPKPVEKNRQEESEKLRPLLRGAQERRLADQARREEAKRKAASEAFHEAHERLMAWEDSQERMWKAWATVHDIRFQLQKRPTGWVPTEDEINRHRLDPDVVAELRADAENPQPKPQLPSTRARPTEELPPMAADEETPEQLALI